MGRSRRALQRSTRSCRSVEDGADSDVHARGRSDQEGNSSTEGNGMFLMTDQESNIQDNFPDLSMERAQ